MSESQSAVPPATLSADLDENIARIRSRLGNASDLLVSEHRSKRGVRYAVFCIDGLSSRLIIQEHLLEALIGSDADKAKLPVQEVRTTGLLDEVLIGILSGDSAVMSEASDCAQIVGTKFWNSRPVEEPQTEALIRGPRDGFTEDFRTNTALVRRRLRDPNLRFETFQLGRRSRTDVAVVYVEGIVNDKLLQEVRRRIHTIDVDEVAGSGFVEQWLTDHQLSPFPQIMSTERPDKLSAALLQGKVGVIVDNTPFQLILPMTIFSFFHSPEDYYQNWIVSTAIRVMRFGAAFLATFMPAFYIALTEFHHGMLPSELAFSIAGSREGVPFPSVVEAFAMEATLELLREAGIRLPKPIGQTIGIVGGLVIGEAAVRAGIVSPIMVIVVAITAISSFSLPSYTFAISLRLLRFLVMLSAALFGLYGIVLAYIMLNIHIANLKSFGIPYSTPFAPTFLSDWKDLILRAPLSMMNGRPKMMRTKDKNRLK
ncbi:spore germination protein [Cohnella ginsengisoli]|uniref:Spore germination protein n=1 Tax=Cohnella ginsengisoli TaxID=425004 RepID=A0A9X4KE94_9BACL|nr:spore germination protein [Cohnella ginsengisoli]MDG0790330.1 spore germination protein [Cohnella ginsengisoli]